MKVKGLEQVFNNFDKYSEKVQNAIVDEINDSAQQIAANANINRPIGAQVAVENATKAIPSATVSAFMSTNNQLGKSNPGNLIAYIEFGTGISAAEYVPTLPKEWQEIAMKYYVNGKGTMVKKPFLYPAYIKEIPKFKDNVLAAVKGVKL